MVIDESEDEPGIVESETAQDEPGSFEYEHARIMRQSASIATRRWLPGASRDDR
jgi:hypothetical protein